MVLYASCEQKPAYLVIEMLVQPISCCRDHVPCIEHIPSLGTQRHVRR